VLKRGGKNWKMTEHAEAQSSTTGNNLEEVHNKSVYKLQHIALEILNNSHTLCKQSS
jgi:hypothetical protein